MHLRLELSPPAFGPASAELRFVDDALDSPQVVHLTATGSAEVKPQPTPPAEEPRSVLGHHPRARTKSRTAIFTFSGNSTTAAFVCQLDRGPFRTCTSPIKYQSLKPGHHQFTVRATSNSGVQTEGAYYGWQVIAKRHKGIRTTPPLAIGPSVPLGAAVLFVLDVEGVVGAGRLARGVHGVR